jgi:DNA-binding transcriptional LysR family regulator
MDRLDAMTAFVAVCDAKGFAAAARRLGLSPSVVTRLVGRLEGRLGVQLLERTTRSVRLTEAGARYLERVKRTLSDIEEAEEIARTDREEPRGHLVVTAPVVFGRLHVAPLLRTYLARHREMMAELRLDDRNLRLIDEGVDIAIRIGALRDSTLRARRLGETRRVVVGSPSYLRRRGRPRNPAALRRHDLIFVAPFSGPREWLFIRGDGRRAGEGQRVPVDARLATNSADAAIDFALDGGGLARVLLYQVMPHVADGSLEIVLDKFEPPTSPIHAVYARARWLPAKQRSFIDLAVETTDWHFTTPQRRAKSRASRFGSAALT